MPDIFLSYAEEDRERARTMAEAFSRSGFDVWWDRQLAHGQVFHQEIERNLEAAKCVVVLWSQASVHSRWVREEAERAAERGVLVPVIMDGVAIPFGFRQFHAATLTPAGELPSELVRSIAQRVHPPQLPPAPAPVPMPMVRASTGAPARRRWMLMLIAAAAVIAVISTVLFQSGFIGSDPPPGTDTGTTTTTPATDTTTPATDTTGTTKTESTAAQTTASGATSNERQDLAELDARIGQIRRHGPALKLRVTSRFYGPIDRDRLEDYISVELMQRRREDCVPLRDAALRKCVADILRDFPKPNLPPEGRIYNITDDPQQVGRVIPLDRPVMESVLDQRSGYTSPVTIVVRGRWGGIASLPCADVIAAAVEFHGGGENFKLWDDDGRQRAEKITGERPKQTAAVVVMKGWPAREPLSARNEGAKKYGVDSTPCSGTSKPQLLLWQHDSRFNIDVDEPSFLEQLRQD